MSDELDMQRVQGVLVATAAGITPEELDPSPAEATQAERMYAAHIAQEIARGWQGVGVLPRRPHVLDASIGDCMRMAHQAHAYLRAFELLWGWWRPKMPGHDKTLGAMLKVIPTDVTERVVAHLREAGLLENDP